jgi:hypothetical protein
VFQFEATRPVRYLAFLVSRFTRVDSSTVAFDDPPAGEKGDVDPAATRSIAGGSGTSLALTVQAQPRQVQRGRELAGRAAEIARFYRSIVGDAPYEGFTLAVVESALPGGHSPAYFAALHQPLPNVPLVWRTDPASFEGFPDFFLAHEIAHQWWGQSVAGRNYHEQWLSEGFAQYFAALYAERSRGPGVFGDMLRHMRKWSLDESDQGPVYLGYRLGHIRGDDRVFRAIVYNKGAAVLHMLRRLVGDEAFFAGLRLFYVGARFRKVGTEDLRVAMESASDRSLERFFERWIYGTSLPRLTFDYRLESTPGGREAVLRFEQAGDIFDLPVTAVFQYADRKPSIAGIPLPVEGALRGIEISHDDGTLVEIR